ncbi:ADP-ribosylglycohydrolase family protein [Pseudoalteromonas ruthenica]|uniref:ADP-ribosylglycohydrolase family protein n=1 Tax=Pseudoalteromonas ruthenica TaxID=151081 RepID=UPI000AD62FD7|nr:ADP-ribosylglycohydrolase family protein [Pseudoalteromonas ruthenica]
MKEKKYYDNDGNLITEASIIALLEQQERIPDDLRFPFMTNRISGGKEPERMQWLASYTVFRLANNSSQESDIRAYLSENGIDNSDLINRFRGALLGLAIGDALGTTLEFQPKGSFAPISEMIGGGPFNLKPGYWTDDTSMMYCLAHSLVRRKGFDAEDQMKLYCKWWHDGIFSSTGSCFDIGNTVKQSLTIFERTGEPFSGSTRADSAGNGSLMRLAPIPLFFHDDFSKAVHYGGQSSKTTHGAIEAVDACRYMSALIWGALNGVSKHDLLDGVYEAEEGYWSKHSLCESISKMIKSGEFKNKSADEIRASGYVMHSLEAALWAFYHSDSYKEGALMAVNLGEDADTTGAIYGQLAGAYYGEYKLPFEWVRKLKDYHVFYLKAEELKQVV